MRLVTSVQVMVGLAASGGALMVLSGSAWAADSNLGTTSRPVAAVTQPELKAPESAVSASDVVAAASPAPHANSDDVAAKKVAPEGQLVQASSSGHEQPLSVGSATDQSASKVAAKPAEASAGGAGAAAIEMTPVRVDVVSGASGGTHLAEGAAVVAIVGTAVDGFPASATAQRVPASHGGLQRTTILPIQPVITNRVAAMAADLASSVPSASMPAKEPSPARSAGLLGNLTAQLAGTALPLLLALQALAADQWRAAAAFSMLVVLLANIFTFTYGLWLRRSGFATAARSDVSAAVIPSFATPFLSGDVTLPLRLHHLIFNGGRNEIYIYKPVLVLNDFRKEEK